MQLTLKADKQYAFRQHMLWVCLLWASVIVSALVVVYSAHDTRNKFSELENLKSHQSELQVEWGKYLLEESAYASFGRVEKIATEKLLMEVPTAKQIVMVNINE